MQKESREKLIDFMKTKLQQRTIEEALIPTFSVGCRRMTPSPNYLEVVLLSAMHVFLISDHKQALTRSNVQAVTSPIEEITSEGCKCRDGSEYNLDIIVCATGFDTSFQPRFPMIGYDNANLQDEWATEPSAYMGIAAAGFPNMFLLYGPYSPIGNGPLHACIGR